jgi:hypothetical protein
MSQFVKRQPGKLGGLQRPIGRVGRRVIPHSKAPLSFCVKTQDSSDHVIEALL